ncbi:hypothetical protein GMSM_46160 [Geomonas sp. Red276]
MDDGILDDAKRAFLTNEAIRGVVKALYVYLVDDFLIDEAPTGFIEDNIRYLDELVYGNDLYLDSLVGRLKKANRTNETVEKAAPKASIGVKNYGGHWYAVTSRETD